MNTKNATEDALALFNALGDQTLILSKIRDAPIWRECERAWGTELVSIELKPVSEVTNCILKAIGTFANQRSAESFFTVVVYEGNVQVQECDQRYVLRCSRHKEICERVPPPR